MKRSPIKRKPPSPRKQLAAAAFKKERARIGKLKGNKPIRSPKYLAFIRKQPCCVPECCCKVIWHMPYVLRKVEAAHCGPHPTSVKADDTMAVPLCGWMHREAPDAQGKDRHFFEKRGLDLTEILCKLHREFSMEDPKEAKRIGIA